MPLGHVYALILSGATVDQEMQDEGLSYTVL